MATTTPVISKYPAETLTVSVNAANLAEVVAGATISSATLTLDTAAGLTQTGSCVINGSTVSAVLTSGNAPFQTNVYWVLHLSTGDIRTVPAALSIIPEI
jgi:hypothetical protein